MSEVRMLKGTETLASLAFTRDKDGHVKTVTSKGLPGEEKPTDEYDSNSRLTKGAGIAYEYDSANNPTKIGAGSYKYNSGDELETGPSLSYTYDELGERTKTKPTTGPPTTYGYDQASDVTSVERPKEGEVAEIKDSYTYNGDGLRVSQTISGTTTYMAWDTAEELPLLLSDGTNSYIYGPGGLPIEQINISTGGTTYLHHDQQGSTRLLTGSAGTVTGKCTYGAYGTATCEGTTTTPLGYDGQYTSSDTGLIYLRARVYDPATAQFLSVDPDVASTGEPYSYGGDDPVNSSDPTGMISAELEGRERYLYEYFAAVGYFHRTTSSVLYRFQIAAMIGNFLQEDGTLSPSKRQGCGPGCGVGIASWTEDERWGNVTTYATNNNRNPESLYVQVRVVWEELHGREYHKALTALEGAQNISSATQAFEKEFEGAEDPEMTKREHFAEQVYKTAVLRKWT
jgi:RHS repeat-associated protein